MGSTFVRTAILRYAPRAVGLMEIENIIRYTPCAVGLKPSARQGKARLRGLWRIIYSKTIHLVVAPQHNNLQSYNVVLLAIAYRLSAIAYRLSAIAYRLSPIAYRLSPIAYRLSPIAYRLLEVAWIPPNCLISPGCWQRASPR